MNRFPAVWLTAPEQYQLAAFYRARSRMRYVSWPGTGQSTAPNACVVHCLYLILTQNKGRALRQADFPAPVLNRAAINSSNLDLPKAQ